MNWDIKSITDLFFINDKDSKKKFFFTDSQDEFINRMENIARSSFAVNKDNLRYLEQLDTIRQIREGVKIEDVYPWLKKDKQC